MLPPKSSWQKQLYLLLTDTSAFTYDDVSLMNKILHVYTLNNSNGQSRCGLDVAFDVELVLVAMLAIKSSSISFPGAPGTLVCMHVEGNSNPNLLHSLTSYPKQISTLPRKCQQTSSHGRRLKECLMPHTLPRAPDRNSPCRSGWSALYLLNAHEHSDVIRHDLLSVQNRKNLLLKQQELSNP